jgi:hypothetical protein
MLLRKSERFLGIPRPRAEWSVVPGGRGMPGISKGTIKSRTSAIE